MHHGITAQNIKQGSVCIHEGGCAANSALVRIEKYTGVAPTLTAFMPPKNA